MWYRATAVRRARWRVVFCALPCWLLSCEIDNRVTSLGLGASSPVVAEPELSAAAGSSGVSPNALPADAGSSVPSDLSGEPRALDFSVVELGLASAVRTWTVTNRGRSHLAPIAVENALTGDVSVDQSCSGSLAPGASCGVSVSWTPSVSGQQGAQLVLRAGEHTATLELRIDARYRLTIAKTGRGRVTSEPAGLDCGETCSGLFGTPRVELTALPEDGFAWKGWGRRGACTSPSWGCGAQTFAESQTLAVDFPAAPYNRVFITSSTYPADLGGAAPYDRACNEVADAMLFQPPSTNGFVAAHSTAASPFRQRVRPGARGWVRMDGAPFADTLEGLLDGEAVLNAVLFDERGSVSRAGQISGRGSYFTGSLADGSAGTNCSDWTSTSGNGLTGSSIHGPRGWIVSADAECASELPILCLETRRSAPLDIPAVSGKAIWLTNTPYSVGEQTPDEKCQLERPAFVSQARAFLSYLDRAAADVLDPNASYVRVDGQLVGTGQELAAGNAVSSGVWQAADGTYGGELSNRAWTGIAVDPRSVGTGAETCGGWTDPGATGRAGNVNMTNAQVWNAGGPLDCSEPNYLYCVEL